MGRYGVLLVGLVVFTGIIAAAFLIKRPVLPDSPPYISGAITRTDKNRVLVEETPGEQQGNKCWFTVDEHTAILRGSDRLTSTSLTSGLRVQAWAKGDVLESYPCQTGAEAIAVLP